MLGVLAVVLCRLLVTSAGVTVGVLDSGVCVTYTGTDMKIGTTFCLVFSFATVVIVNHLRSILPTPYTSMASLPAAFLLSKYVWGSCSISGCKRPLTMYWPRHSILPR